MSAHRHHHRYRPSTVAPSLRGLALLAALACAWQPVRADTSREALRDALDAAQARQWREHILAPASRGTNGELQASPAPELPQLRAQALAELRAADVPALLGANATLDNWMPSLTLHFTYSAAQDDNGYTPWPEVTRVQGPVPEPRAPRLPDWVAPALRERLAAFRLTQWTQAAPRPPWVWDGEADNTVGQALVWSGPAVKDGVARYQVSKVAGQERTTVRLAAWPDQTASLLRWAERHNLPLKLTLDTGTQPLSLAQAAPVRVDLSTPVWLITPQELLPATLKTLRTGDTCHGGGWVEVELPGNRQPAIWGTLFLPDAATAAAAQVKRLPAEKPAEGSAAHTVSRVEVSWPDRRLNALLLSAKQFGTVWGTQTDVLVFDHGQPVARRLGGSGKPACGI